MNDNNLNNFNNVSPNQTPVTPVQQIQQSIEPQIDPSFGTNVASPVQPVPSPTKKKSILPIIIVVLIILVIAAFVVWKFVLPTFVVDSNSKPTTTTTTTKTGKELLDIKNIDDYLAITTNDPKIIKYLDDSFKELPLQVSSKCQNDGDEISFEKYGLSISYKCIDAGTEESTETKKWNADGLINGTYKLTYNKDSNSHYQTNGKQLVTLHLATQSTYAKKLVVDNLNGEVIYDGYYVNYYMKPVDGINNGIPSSSSPIINDNVLYFIDADDYENGGSTLCRIKYIDFDSDTPSVQQLNTAEVCYLSEN